MQKASELAATAVEQGKSQTDSTASSATDSRKSAPSAWVAAIFRRLQAVHGARWTASIDGIEADAVREWSRALGDMTPEQIRRGLDNLNSDWPPTLPEFKRLCEGRGKNEYGLDYIPQYYRETRHERLLDQPRDEEAAKEHLAKMRAALRGAA